MSRVVAIGLERKSCAGIKSQIEIMSPTRSPVASVEKDPEEFRGQRPLELEFGKMNNVGRLTCDLIAIVSRPLLELFDFLEVCVCDDSPEGPPNKRQRIDVQSKLRLVDLN